MFIFELFVKPWSKSHIPFQAKSLDSCLQQQLTTTITTIYLPINYIKEFKEKTN